MDEIINYWGRKRSQDLYRDGVITYKAPNKHFGDAFLKLEKTLGIETQKVRRKKDAEIFCEFGDPANKNWAGVYHASTSKRGKPQGHIVVRPNKSYSQSTVIHEIGHALGLNHPGDHSRTDTIMSYGAPDDLPWFTKLDRSALVSLYA